MEWPKPMYKAGESQPKYPVSEKEVAVLKDQGWTLNYIHQDWPKGAWDEDGNFQLAKSEEDAAARGLSFTKPTVVTAAAALKQAAASREDTITLQSQMDLLEARLAEAEVKIADLEAAFIEKPSPKSKKSKPESAEKETAA